MTASEPHTGDLLMDLTVGLQRLREYARYPRGSGVDLIREADSLIDRLAGHEAQGIPLIPDEALRERLASLEHDQWVEWSRTVAEQGLTPERLARWESFWVPYDHLDEPTKEHDRVWADKVLSALAATPPASEHQHEWVREYAPNYRQSSEANDWRETCSCGALRTGTDGESNE